MEVKFSSQKPQSKALFSKTSVLNSTLKTFYVEHSCTRTKRENLLAIVFLTWKTSTFKASEIRKNKIAITSISLARKQLTTISEKEFPNSQTIDFLS